MDGQITMFDFLKKDFSVKNKIRLIELFAGYGSQAMALRNIGADFETYRVVEFDKYAIASYNAIHGTNFPTIDICDVHGEDLGIVDKDKYDYLLTYSFPCGLPGTKVKVDDGYKNIEDVKVGDLVLTHKNRYEKVEKVMKRKSPDYYRIKVLGYPKLQLTSEHPMYVLRDLEIQWVKVKDLKTTDKVCFNINTKSVETKCSNEILWLLGRYAADGHVNKYSCNSVNFSIGDKKVDDFMEHLPEEMKEKFKAFKKPGIVDFRIADLDFQELCLDIGLGSQNKQIPQWIQDLPVEQAKVFFDGYMSGDGHIRKNRNGTTYQFCTTSKEMFFGLQNLVLKIYGTVCSCWLRSDYRKETFNDTYNAQFSPSGKSTVQQRIGDQMFVPVREVSHVEEETDVYNFQVENDNSYTCENIVVHNCTDISIAGRMAGMSEDSDTRSSLLWQVRRILLECKDNLPQILVMENVPAIHNGQNMPDFRIWLDFLNELGYSSYMQDLNAWDFDLAQNRERTFVVSLLGEYNYKFPETISDLDFCMEDYFEDLTEEQALQLVVKSEKALDLLVKLDEKGQLE